MRLMILMLFAAICITRQGEAEMSIPSDFPRFEVPGFEKQMESLRELYWLHYPGSGRKATMWDAWLTENGLRHSYQEVGSLDHILQRITANRLTG